MALANNFSDADPTAGVHAAHHNALADAVNPLAGGTTGQVPAKSSGADYAIIWTTPFTGASFVSSAKWGTD